MTTYNDLRDFFSQLQANVIIAADGETRTHVKKGSEIVEKTSAGGVSIAFEAIARASHATYISRGRTEEDETVVNRQGEIDFKTDGDRYTLKRLFLTEKEIEDYYYGYANQSLWPLCHIAFQRPIFRQDWYEGYINVNKRYAKAIEEKIKGKSFIWINDYQLSLVPLFLNKPKDSSVGFFWHIPWPNWETFRILPNKKDILWSLLSCDFLAFHRGYQVRNFLNCVRRELEVRIDEETNTIFFDKNKLQVKSLPMGIDTDTIQNLVAPEQDTFFIDILRNILGENTKQKKTNGKESLIDKFFNKYQVMLGVDRLDYTKGLINRLYAIDRFFEKYPQYIEKAIYVGILAPSRSEIPSYALLKKQVVKLVNDINRKYKTKTWKPLYTFHENFTREDIINLYKRAKICLVTPLDDGMNLVSKEFIMANSLSDDPGMLVLSQFAGSAIDLTSSLIINPYNIDSLADAIKKGLEMDKKEKKERVEHMVKRLEDHNVYEWARSFTNDTIAAAKENMFRP